MAELKLKAMTVSEFLDWQLKQDELYELVNGAPLILFKRQVAKMMTGATANHDTVTVNALVSLGHQLKGKPCRPHTDDIAVIIPAGNIRRPDMLVECGKPNPKDMTAKEPRLVMEVLSPSTMNFDRVQKLEEYKTVESITTIILVDTQRPQVTIFRREAEHWQMDSLISLEAMIALPDIEAQLALTDLYEGVVFESEE